MNTFILRCRSGAPGEKWNVLKSQILSLHGSSSNGKATTKQWQRISLVRASIGPLMEGSRRGLSCEFTFTRILPQLYYRGGFIYVYVYNPGEWIYLVPSPVYKYMLVIYLDASHIRVSNLFIIYSGCCNGKKMIEWGGISMGWL